jgi:hypothetical protein
MSFSPIAYTAPQYDKSKFKNWWLKPFEEGTTIPKLMSTNSTGTPTAAKFEVNSDGFFITAGSVIVIPHIDGDYDLWLFPTEAEADANDTTNATQLADNINASQELDISDKLNPLTVSAMVNDTRFSVDDVGKSVPTTKEFSTGGGGGTYDIELTSSVTPDAMRIIRGVANNLISFVLRDEPTLNINSWGALGDWNGTTGTDNQPIIEAASDYLGADGGQIDFPAFPGGRYKLSSKLTINEGVVLNGLGTVGSVNQKGVKFICDHIGDGVVFDGNNSSGSTEGAEQQIFNIWILKGPNRNGGDGLKFISTDGSNTPGFMVCDNVHVIGNSVSSGEGLWSRGWVFDGTQATIGLKNGSFNNCGVSGVSTANGYLDVKNLSETTFNEFYVRDASASFPSAGAVGITLDSTQVGGDPAISNPSTAIQFSNSRILGDIIVGEVAKLSLSNTFAVNLTPSGVPGSGTNISWAGGELVNKYVDATSYSVRVNCINQNSTSDLSNQFRTAASLTLGKAHSGITITHPSAAGNLSHAFPQVKGTDVFDIIIKNNGAFTVTITKEADNFFRPQGANLNSNITDIVIPAGSTARFRSNGNTGDSTILVTVSKGLITLTGLGTMSENGVVARISVLTGNLLNRSREANHFILDAGAANRNFSGNTANWDVGDPITVVNFGSANNILFDAADDGGFATAVVPGTSQRFVFDGTIYSKIV